MLMFVNRLNEALKSEGLSQSDLAKKLEVNRQNVSRWCSGEFEPNFETLVKICKMLNKTPNYMLGYDE